MVLELEWTGFVSLVCDLKRFAELNLFMNLGEKELETFLCASTT